MSPHIYFNKKEEEEESKINVKFNIICHLRLFLFIQKKEEEEEESTLQNTLD